MTSSRRRMSAATANAWAQSRIWSTPWEFDLRSLVALSVFAVAQDCTPAWEGPER